MPADERPDLTDPAVLERMWRAFEAAADDTTVVDLRTAMTAAATAPTEPARFRNGDPCSIYVPPECCPDIPTCRVHHQVGRLYAEDRAARAVAARHTRPQLLTWDQCDQPDMRDLAAIIRRLSGGTIHLHEVATGDRQYAIVLATRDLDGPECRDLYARHLRGGR